MEEFDRIFAEKTAPYIEKFTDFYNQNPSILALETLFSLKKQLDEETEKDEILLKSCKNLALKSLLNNHEDKTSKQSDSKEKYLSDFLDYLCTDHFDRQSEKEDYQLLENEVKELGLDEVPEKVMVNVNRIFYLRKSVSIQKLSKSSISIICSRAVREQYPDKLPADQKPTDQEIENSFGKPHNYKGELSQDAIKDLTEYRKEKPNLPINDFFRTAFNRYPSCRYLLKDGKPLKVSSSTIRDRVKRDYPNIYHGNL